VKWAWVARSRPPVAAADLDVNVHAVSTGESNAYVAFIAEVGGRLVGAIDMESAASLAVELAIPTLSESAMLVLPDVRGRLEWWRWSGRGRCLRGRIRRPAASSAPGLTSVLVGNAELAELSESEVSGLPRAFADPLARHPSVSAVSLPSCQGALLLGRRDSLGSDERRAVEEFVARVSAAVVAAHRFERQKEAAAELSRALRPPALPDLPGIRMAAIYRPAAGPLDVGGDFYDLHPRSDGSMVFMLGDVCGKGAEAAAMSGRVRHALAALRLVESDPERLLHLVNQALLGTGGNKFATLVLGVLARRSDGSLLFRLSSGGHPPPLVLRSSGIVETIVVPGMLVGIMPRAEFGTVMVELAPRDTLILYTDGITEARGPNDALFGSDRLHSALSSCVNLPVEQIVTRLDDSVQQWAPAGRDDIAVLAIQSAPGQ
jgi:sigma-B regulation protein RsbU (phosphoserine phosphatase)